MNNLSAKFEVASFTYHKDNKFDARYRKRHATGSLGVTLNSTV